MPPTLPDDRPLWNLVFGHLAFRSLQVAKCLGVFELLASGPHTLDQICERLSLEPRAARALVTPCVAAGLVDFRRGAYALSKVGQAYLDPASPLFFGHFLDMITINDASASFEAVESAVRHNAAQVYGGKDLFESNEAQTALARIFTRGMHSHSAGGAAAWPGQLDLSAHRVMLDIGGGSGVHAIRAVEQWPELRAIVLERPFVLDIAREQIAQSPAASRIEAVESDMWNEPYPAGDLHFYGDIFHDWPVEKGRLLAKKSFDSLPSGGRILLHEILFEADGHRPLVAAGFNLGMLLWTEGQQFTAAELEALLLEAGFRDPQTRATFGYWSIVSARKH